MKTVSRRRRDRKSAARDGSSPSPTKHAVPVDFYEAFREVVYTFGVDAMAKAIGISPGVMYAKADANLESHHQPTLRDVFMVTRESQDMRVLDCLDRRFDRAAFDTSPMEACSDEALLELLCRIGKEKGEFCLAVRAALHAERFTPDRLQLIRAEAFDLVSEVMAFLVRVEGMVDV